MAIDARAVEPASGLGTGTPAPRNSSPVQQLAITPRASAGLWHDAARRLRRDHAAVAGLLIILLLIVIAIVAPWITPYDPNDQSFRIKLKPPSAEHWLGTDEFGRDVLSRILVGTRVALYVGIVPVVVAMIIGVTLGLA